MKSDLAYAMQHRYRLEHNGAFVPGVTTVIGVLDKPGLKWSAAGIAATVAIENGRRKRTVVKEHRAKLLASKGRGDAVRAKQELGANGTDNDIYAHWCRAQFDVQWRAKADRGTRVHELVESLSRGESVDVPSNLIGYLHAWQRFVKEYKLTPHYSECVVGGETPTPDIEFPRLSSWTYGYGGRFDILGALDGPGASGLMLTDYKTGSERELENALQAIGYKRASLIAFDEKGSITGLNPLPEVDGCRTVYLHEDGSIAVKDPFAKIDEEDAWRAFSACNTLYATMKGINDALGKGQDD